MSPTFANMWSVGELFHQENKNVTPTIMKTASQGYSEDQME